MKLIRQFLSSSVILCLSFIIRFLLTLTLARNLSSNDLGIYSWVVTVFGFMGIITNFGLDYFLLRKVPEYRNSDHQLIGAVIYSTQRKASIYSLLFIVSIFAGSLILNQFHYGVSNYIYELMIISLALPFAAFSLIFSTSLRGYNFARTAQIIEVIVQSGVLLFAVSTMSLFYDYFTLAKRPTALLAAVFVVSWMISCGWAFYQYRRYLKLSGTSVPTRDNEREWHAERLSILYGVVGGSILGRSDIFLLAFLVTPSEVGTYFICFRLAELLMFSATASYYVWSGKISNLIQRGELEQAQVIITKAAQLCLVTTAPLTLFGLIFPKQILSFFNASYAGNETLFQIAVCIFFCKGASGMLRPLFYLLKDQDFIAKYNWIMGSVFTILVIVIVPNFGLVGCIITFGICELTYLTILTVRMYKKFKIDILPFQIYLYGPSIIKFLKKMLRRAQGRAEKGVLGGFFQGLIWRYKHLYESGWPTTSLSSTELPYRNQLVSEVTASSDCIQSVLEIGCGAGPNLRLVRQKIPSARLVGIDINKKAVETAKNYFKTVADDNTVFFVRKAYQLSIFEDSTFDVCFSNAVMVCHPPNDFIRAVKEMLRVTKSTIIFNEFHKDGAIEGVFNEGRWVYDYASIFKELSPGVEVKLQPSHYTGGDWDIYGKLITVSLRK